jgi:outer membrane lipoprotein-sorting protein
MKSNYLKIGALLVMFLMSVVNFMAQKPVSEERRQLFGNQITEASKKIQTLQCSFIQEKTSALVSEKAVAKGILLYQSPSMLRWEYTEPTPSTLILNGNDAVLLDKNDKKVGNEKMLRQLGGIIISMINGNGIAQNKQFSSEFYEIDGAQMLIVLTPIQKRLKDFYNKIELRIDLKTMLADNITLDEKSGDKTIIFLTNKVLNSEIPQSKFAIK